MSISVPNTFTSGITFFATQMNANYASICSALSSGNENLSIAGITISSAVVSGNVDVTVAYSLEGSLSVTGDSTFSTLTTTNSLKTSKLSIGTKEQLTILSESITPTKTNIKVIGSTLSSIVTTNFSEGSLLIISKDSTSPSSITLNQTDNIILGSATRVLNSIYDKIVLQLIDNKWYELYFGDNA